MFFTYQIKSFKPPTKIELPQHEMDVVERVFMLVNTTSMLFDDKDKDKEMGPTLQGHDNELVFVY